MRRKASRLNEARRFHLLMSLTTRCAEVDNKIDNAVQIFSADRKSACRAVKPPPGSNEGAIRGIRDSIEDGSRRGLRFFVAVGRLPVKGAFSRIRKRATTAGDGRHLKEEKGGESQFRIPFVGGRRRLTEACKIANSKTEARERAAGRREYCGRQDKHLGDVARRTRKDGEPKGAQPSAREGRRAGVTSPGVTVWVSSAAEHLDGGRVSPASRLSQRFLRSSSRSRGGIGSEQLHGARLTELVLHCVTLIRKLTWLEGTCDSYLCMRLP
ncbi:uncharacterized protein [Excalfactoria chinensis]|uniref:uncharacterized protein n=1 Tax=Excalfactoria chinensis TaxID=46218 RepID=UPI003B3A9C50